MITVQNRKLIDISKLAKLYSADDFRVIKQIDSSRDKSDKRFVFILSFDDVSELVIKACKNDFTSEEKVLWWQKTQNHYLNLGIYCPQIVNTLSGKVTQKITIDGEEFVVYAEQIKKYKTLPEANMEFTAEIRKKVIEGTSRVAAFAKELVPYPSVYCLYQRFCESDKYDENYENALSFHQKISNDFPQYKDYADKIWSLFIQKRTEFEPVYFKLHKAVFQADLNSSNILVDDNGDFAGLIDFNLSGTESVLCYILLPEVCLYELNIKDLPHLNEPSFLKKCDEFLLDNLKTFAKYYKFTDIEKKHFNLCYNTVVPFCFCMVTRLLDYVIENDKTNYIQNILGWVYYQLTRRIDLNI